MQAPMLAILVFNTFFLIWVISVRGILFACLIFHVGHIRLFGFLQQFLTSSLSISQKPNCLLKTCDQQITQTNLGLNISTSVPNQCGALSKINHFLLLTSVLF